MKIDFKYPFGDIVYLKTDIEQLPRQILQVSATSNGVMYQLTQETFVSWHYEFEIQAEKDIILSTSN